MAAGYRFAARPGWLAGHVAVLAAFITMILLGHWQLTVSERKGFSLQNFGYAFQWWIFAGFAVVLWAKVLRDNARRPAAEDVTPAESAEPVEAPVAYRRYVMPQMRDAVADDGDDVHSAYNAYLRSLSGAEEGA